MIVFIEKNRTSSDAFIMKCFDKYCELADNMKLTSSITNRKPKIVRTFLTNTPVPLDGKPHFDDGPYFSLSHSGEYQVLAMSDTDLGIDVEKIKEGDYIKMAERFFAEEEYAQVKAEGVIKFFDLWTKKEAYTKYLGGSIIKSLGVKIEDVANDNIIFYTVNIIDGYSLNVCYDTVQEVVILTIDTEKNIS